MKSLYFSNRNLPKPPLNSPEHPPKSPSKIPWRSRQVDYWVTWVYENITKNKKPYGKLIIDTIFDKIYMILLIKL